MLPHTGGVRDQPYLLMRAIEAVVGAMVMERNARQRDAEEAMVARMMNR